RWLAFVSTESGLSEVYIAPADDTGARRRVSAAGGVAPRWRRDGRELFYLTPDHTLVAIPVAAGRELQRGSPVALFKAIRFYESRGFGGDAIYEPSPDGQRFLINRVVEDASTKPITVLLNWTALLPK
ncbi:MAG: hypothetical protein ACRD2N_14505, partial [Vicinamibacterales bacterium]